MEVLLHKTFPLIRVNCPEKNLRHGESQSFAKILISLDGPLPLVVMKPEFFQELQCLKVFALKVCQIYLLKSQKKTCIIRLGTIHIRSDSYIK